MMKLKDVINLVDDSQNIVLLVNSNYVGVFPIIYCPKQYFDYIVTGLMPDVFEGSSPFDGVVLKIWIEVGTDTSVS